MSPAPVRVTCVTPPGPPPRPSAAVYRRRRVTAFGAFGLTLAVAFYLPLTLLAPLRPAEPVAVEQPAPTASTAQLDWPGYGAAAVSAVGYPGVLARAGTEDALPMASITKVVTALVVLERMPLGVGETGPSHVITAADVQLRAGYAAMQAKVVPVTAGMTFTERQLLEMTLIESYANAAATLARWAFGSDAAFLAAAEAWLAAHGLGGIRVVDPTGIDTRNVGPVDQLVQLGIIALDHPVVAEIVATGSTTIPGVGMLENTNELLGAFGVDGIKTGTLDSFGANLLFSADLVVGTSIVPVVGVVVGGPDHDILDRDVAELLATVADGFREVVVAEPGEEFARYSTVWGLDAAAVAEETATLLVWSDSPVTVEASFDELRDGAAGDRLGEVVFTSGPRSVVVELVLSTDVEDPGPWWRLVNPALLF